MRAVKRFLWFIVGWIALTASLGVVAIFVAIGDGFGLSDWPAALRWMWVLGSIGVVIVGWAVFFQWRANRRWYAAHPHRKESGDRPPHASFYDTLMWIMLGLLAFAGIMVFVALLNIRDDGAWKTLVGSLVATVVSLAGSVWASGKSDGEWGVRATELGWDYTAYDDDLVAVIDALPAFARGHDHSVHNIMRGTMNGRAFTAMSYQRWVGPAVYDRPEWVSVVLVDAAPARVIGAALDQPSGLHYQSSGDHLICWRDGAIDLTTIEALVTAAVEVAVDVGGRD